MAYRNDEGHEAERIRSMNAQIAELERRLAERNVLRAHKERVDAQLRDATNAAAKHRAKVPLPLLARVRVASPCQERWDQMTGDERVRHCAACDKDVYDLSEMTTAEAEELLANVGEQACIRLHRRADGTVITSDCPVGAKRKRRNRWLAAGAALAGSAMAAGSVVTSAATVTAGEPAFAPVSGAMEVSSERALPHNGDAVYEPEIDEEEYYAPVPGGPMFVPAPDGDDAPEAEDTGAP